MFILISCEGNKPVKIGFIAGLTGRVADLGVSGRNGVMLAIEQKNSSGGIDGKTIELMVRDDKQNPETAITMTRELMEADVEVIIGPMTSSMAIAMVPVVEDSEILLVSPTATTTDLEGIDDNFIRVISTTRDYASKSARFHYEQLDKRTAVAIYDLNNKSYTESWLNEFKKAFEGLGGSLKKIHSFHSGKDTAFFEMTRELLKENTDLFIIVTNAIDAVLICQQIRKIDPDITIAAAEWASTERFVELGGSAAEGVYVAQFLDRNDTSNRYMDFRKAYIDRFGQEPGFAGIAGYDAGKIVIDSLENRQKSSQSLKEIILNQKNYSGVQQKITLNQYGDADRNTFVTVIQNGKYITLK